MVAILAFFLHLGDGDDGGEAGANDKEGTQYIHSIVI